MVSIDLLCDINVTFSKSSKDQNSTFHNLYMMVDSLLELAKHYSVKCIFTFALCVEQCTKGWTSIGANSLPYDFYLSNSMLCLLVLPCPYL